MNYRLVSRFLSLLVALFSLSMSLALPFAMWYGEWSEFLHFIESAAMGCALAGILYTFGRRATGEMYRREALAVVGLSWVLAAGVGALPFYFSGMIGSYSGSYFESMSGLTTTGASVLTNIESNAKCLLFWRSFLHFVGGLGIIVLFVAVLPLVGVGGRVLFKQEVPGPVPEGMTPRIKDTAMLLLKVYVGFNVLQALLLMFAGLTPFDAINHAMATLATGGFSTKNTSVLAFGSQAVEWIIIVFMFLAGTNFSLHLEAVQGRFSYWKSTEFRAYLLGILGSAIFITVLLHVSGATFTEPGSAPVVSNTSGIHFRDALFATLSMQTTTGFATVDFDRWPEAARFLLVALMLVGGCAGSTGGGIKVIRWVILFKVARQELGRAVSPRRVRVLKIDGKPMRPETVGQVQTFFYLYIVIIVVGSILLALLEPDTKLLSTFTAVVSALNNIGPGLEEVGPTMNYAFMEAPALWLLSLLMLLGRLELLAVLVFFSRTFWHPR
ncbi:MAG: trk/ktr system potassium uptake protein [Candidatus Sumerlaeota bacterium]|nr:trk/ktr system potassium uptake protein [Candidatus Sumerlaeota bacterium]